MKESKIEEKLKRTEARLNKAAEEKKNLKAKMKQLAEQAENERLVSRGKILESFYRLSAASDSCADNLHRRHDSYEDSPKDNEQGLEGQAR